MRLADLTPDSVADNAHDAALGHTQRLAFALGYDLAPGGAGLSDIRFACRVLTVYAQTGQPPNDAPVAEYYLSLLPLYSSPSEQDSPTEIPGPEGAEPSTPWGLVLRACLVRDKLADDDDVTPAELAVLASVNPDAIRKLIRAGEITERSKRDSSTSGSPTAMIPARAAKQWLSGRGIKGF